jgi:8-oxo-dGTP pyrophosphatase MutT (NUDIX family)
MPVPQAGGIVFRRGRDGISILLVRAKRDPTIWIFPKGHIEPGETPEQTALRETSEEAGVEGEIVGTRVGAPEEFHNGRYVVRVEYFLIHATRESPQTDGREKRWFPIDDAIEIVCFDSMRAQLREIKAVLRE